MQQNISHLTAGMWRAKPETVVWDTAQHFHLQHKRQESKRGKRRGSKLRHDKNLLTVFRSPALFFFSFCSPRLLSVHHNPSVHPSAGHFLRHRAWSILMLRDNVLGMKAKHLTPPDKKENSKESRARTVSTFPPLGEATCCWLLPLSLSLTLSSPVILLKFSMYAPSPSNVSLPPSLSHPPLWVLITSSRHVLNAKLSCPM